MSRREFNNLDMFQIWEFLVVVFVPKFLKQLLVKYQRILDGHGEVCAAFIDITLCWLSFLILTGGWAGIQCVQNCPQLNVNSERFRRTDLLRSFACALHLSSSCSRKVLGASLYGFKSFSCVTCYQKHVRYLGYIPLLNNINPMY